MTLRRAPLTSAILALALFSAAAQAEALLVPMNAEKVATHHIRPIPGPIPQPQPLPLPSPGALPFRITSSKVNVRIDENIATTSMEQSFLNLTGRDLEVRVLIPLPAGATINSSALSMNDQMIEGKLYDAQQAQSIYESIVRQRRDPALLRFAGENLYEARIFPIAPNQERVLKFSYTQVLAPNGGLYDYRHILAGSQLYKDGIEKFGFECTIRSKTRLGPVYSPSHQVAVQRPDENTARISISGVNMSSESDFRLYYAPTTEDVAFRMMTHRNSGDDGYFMLIGRVDDQLEKARILPKEIVFVADTSGSMQGEKIEQTRKALKFCLQSLNDSDRFNLITFATDVQGLSTNLLDAGKANIAKAVAAVDQIEATGGTNIDGALRAALGSDFSDGSAKAKMIVFMTDGLPTVGVTDPQSILQGVAGANPKKVRIFNFGVGNDVNTHLLDKMSLTHDGVSSYVTPREDIEIKVSDFYSKIRHPVMTDVSFDFGSGSVSSVYPRRIPALFRGGEITILGRYKGSGPGAVTLTGNVAGDTRTISVNVNWAPRDLENAYMPRVWAMRKIGHLLEDVRLNGHNPEIITEIVALAQRHGIVTPYTSQLVLEPGMENQVPPRPGRGFGVPVADAPATTNAPATRAAAMELDRDARKKTEAAAKQVAQSATSTSKGDIANALSIFEKNLKEAKSAPAPLAATPPGAAGDKAREERRRQLGEALQANQGLVGGFREANGIPADNKDMADALELAEARTIKQLGTRTFYNRGGVWVDSTVKNEAKPAIVKTFSKEYFELLKSDDSLGPVLALGGRILVMVKDTLYQIED